jgi:YihY family inner membrane protein
MDARGIGRRLWRLLTQAFAKFMAIDGTMRAAAFAYYAFFSLFPLLVLFVTIGSLFFARDVVLERMIEYIESYTPLESETRRHVFDTIAGIVAARGKVGAVAGLILLWGAVQFFKALVRATNRAWDTDMHNWWQMPLKGLALLGTLGSALVLGLTVPVLAKLAERWLPDFHGVVSWAVGAAIAVVPLLVLFCGLAVFYRLAPRRETRMAEVWPAAVAATALLWVLERLFLLYLENFGRFNAVYGALGGVMALMMWIYLSGCVVVFGACLTAAGAEKRPGDG